MTFEIAGRVGIGLVDDDLVAIAPQLREFANLDKDVAEQKIIPPSWQPLPLRVGLAPCSPDYTARAPSAAALSASSISIVVCNRANRVAMAPRAAASTAAWLKVPAGPR